MYRYPLETTKNSMNVMKNNLLLKIMKHLPIDQYIHNFWDKLG